MTAPQEPLVMTLGKALSVLRKRGLNLVPPEEGTDSWGTTRIANWDAPDHEFDTWPEAVSDALGRTVVDADAPARDDAAHLEAERSKWWSAYVEVAGFLGMVSTDDTGRIGAVAGMEEVLAELEQREKDAAELRAALKALLDPEGHDPAYDPTFGPGEPSKQAVNRARAALAATEGRDEA